MNKPKEKPPLTSDDCMKIAEAIKRISASAKAMKNSGLSTRAIIVLLQASTGLPLQTIRTVLDEAELLSTWCLS